MNVLLISMPFGALDRPALGISLLKSTVTEMGAHCDIRYFTFTFAEFIGCADYVWISSELPYTAFAGDWVFCEALYGNRPVEDREYIQEVLRDVWRINDSGIQRILRIRSQVEQFLDYCLTAIDWERYGIVGFTSTFEQNIASLALAHRLKDRHRHIALVFGGANWEEEMGRELHRQFTFVDYVCSGEADESFPALLQRLKNGQRVEDPTHHIPGVIFRAGTHSLMESRASLLRQVDEQPIPDFSDYFEALSESDDTENVVPILLMETSRGCWWGAISHCTFCGLNGGSMAFRSKSAERALNELYYLVDTWMIDVVEIVDNILDMRYFHDFLPELARARRPIRLYYEVKSNLSRDQVRILSQAGVHRIQPGIESMSDRILKLMKKGVTALRNIQLLKWCKQYGIEVDWNILYGFPGETKEDYDAMLNLLPAIRFLQPPCACGPVRLDRFSPYFCDSTSYGLRNIRPMAPYKYLYPFGDDSLSRIAYYFDYDYAPAVDPTGVARDVIAYVEEWQRNPEGGMLESVATDDGALRLNDTRMGRGSIQHCLTGLERVAYQFCDEMRTTDSISRHLMLEYPFKTFTKSQLLDFLHSLVANHLMVTDGLHFLSLAIPASAMQKVEEKRLLAVGS